MIEKMNALRNKKGFTLIEMLVVIAVIAVLVSIVIPTVTSATDKAAAATNAANLRSYKAAVTTAYLADSDAITIPDTATGTVEVTVPDNVMTPPVAKKMEGIEGKEKPQVKFDTTKKEFIVTYGTYTIDHFTKVADGTAKSLAEAAGKK